MAIKTNEILMSVAEAAAEMDLSVHTVRKYIQRKLITPFATVGNVHVITARECARYNRERNSPGNPLFAKKARRKRA